MKNSLQHRLSVWLSVSIVLTGILAGVISFWLSFDEAHELQDDMLRQIAALVDVGRLPADGKRVSVKSDNDPEANITVRRIAPTQLEPTGNPVFPANLGNGFHTLEIGGESMRVFVHTTAQGEKIAVMQSTQMRAEAAQDSATLTVLPLLGLIPLLVFIARWIVRISLAPVRTLARVADEQPEGRPASLPSVDVPDEIEPFIHSINRLLERVNRMVAQQRRFIADAAHELRTPLTALSLQVQNLRQAESIEIMRNRIQPLEAGIDRARHLAEQLLDLARMQGGTDTATIVDVAAMTRELIAEFLPLAEQKHIDLGLEELAPTAIKASSETLRLILSNGLANAVKYTPEHGEITIRLNQEDGNIIIEIVDNGPGIPAAELEKVFDAFHRFSDAKRQGSGLGLTIAREAAMRLGGRLTIQPRNDASGLVFRYTQRME